MKVSIIILALFLHFKLHASQDKEIDIFQKNNSLYLNLLKDNLFDQISNESVTKTYSIIDCLYSTGRGNKTDDLTHFQSFCLVNDNYTTISPYEYESTDYKNGTSNKTRKYNSKSPVDMNDPLDSQFIDKDLALKDMKDFLCSIEKRCNNQTIVTYNDKSYCYLHSYNPFNSTNNITTIYVLICNLEDTQLKNTTEVSLVWIEDKNIKKKTPNENTPTQAYVKGGKSYIRYDKISNRFERNNTIIREANKFIDYVKNQFPNLTKDPNPLPDPEPLQTDKEKFMW